MKRIPKSKTGARPRRGAPDGWAVVPSGHVGVSVLNAKPNARTPDGGVVKADFEELAVWDSECLRVQSHDLSSRGRIQIFKVLSHVPDGGVVVADFEELAVCALAHCFPWLQRPAPSSFNNR